MADLDIMWSRLLYLRVAQILYSMHVLCFHISYQFTGQIFAEHVQVNNLTQHLASVATSVVRYHQLYTIHFSTDLTLFLGSLSFLNLERTTG